MAETKLSTAQLGSDTEVYNQENLLPGYNVSITEIPQPIVDPNTVALWHFDGNLTDEISGLTMNGKQTSDYHKFGTGSGYEVGQYDSGFTSWKTEIPGINFEQDSFTVDGWVYYNGSGAQKIMFGAGYKSGYYFCGTGIALVGTDSCVRAYFNKSGSDDYGSADYPLTTQGWHHLAVQQDFDNQKVQFFVDGHMFYEASGLCQSIYSNTTVNIANAESVWYDEIRVSNVVRWTEDFTPFSQPYANSSVSPKYKINNTLDISGKQDTISDLDTIRSGAAAGATAVQPSALATVATSGDYDDLTNKPAAATDMTGADGTNAGTHGLVPAPSATDNVKFLRGDGTWAEASGSSVTVDQTYDATSTNAQSGTAVAQAVAGVHIPTFTRTWYKNNTGSSITIASTSGANSVAIYRNGVLLEPTEDYTISGTTLTLTGAPLNADEKITLEVF